MFENEHLYEDGLTALICVRAADVAGKTDMADGYRILSGIVSEIGDVREGDMHHIASEFLWRASPAMGEANAVLFIRKVLRGFAECPAM